MRRARNRRRPDSRLARVVRRRSFGTMDLTKYWAATLDDYAIDLAWSPDGALLAAASAAGQVALLAAADGARAHLLPGHPDGANCVAWQPGVARSLASGGQDGAVRFWDAAAGQHTATASLGDAWVEHIAWSTGAGGSPLLLAAVLGVWLVMMMVFGMVGLGSIVASAALPLLALLGVRGGWLPPESLAPLLGFGIACALLVLWTHRANLARMRAGTEPHAKRLWLLGRLRK